jgi:uncharacterized protein (DUF1501 family)
LHRPHFNGESDMKKHFPVSSHPFSRRQFIAGLSAASLISALPGLSFAAGGQGDKKLVVVFLRGAMDGLHLIAPYADPAYSRLRGALAEAATTDAHKLDANFSLHRAMNFSAELFSKKQLLPIIAVAPPYRQRSHFDAQDCLENGSNGPDGASDGWLNRCLSAMPNQAGLALATVMPLILRGPANATTWSPPLPSGIDGQLIDRLAPLYAADPTLAESYRLAIEMPDANSAKPSMGGRGQGNRLIQTMRQAAIFMSAANGPSISFVEDSGWDTHINQAASLQRKFTELDNALKSFQQTANAIWKNTVVIIITEFGRTAAANGNAGTDHGTGGVMLLAGGAVQGGKVAGQFAGLSNADLNEGRDIRTTTDSRAVLKGILRNHLGIAESALEAKIFPQSRAIKPMESLVS